MVTEQEQIQGALFAARSGAKLRVGLVVAAILVASASLAPAQTELKSYVGANGYIQIQKLTCAQLANTYQEDAELLGVWLAQWPGEKSLHRRRPNQDRHPSGDRLLQSQSE